MKLSHHRILSVLLALTMLAVVGCAREGSYDNPLPVTADALVKACAKGAAPCDVGHVCGDKTWIFQITGKVLSTKQHDGGLVSAYIGPGPDTDQSIQCDFARGHRYNSAKAGDTITVVGGIFQSAAGCSSALARMGRSEPINMLGCEHPDDNR